MLLVSEMSQRRNEKVLITQPNDQETDDDDDIDDWDFETADEVSKKKQILEMPDVDISDEKAFDTDLEGFFIILLQCKLIIA